MRVHEGSLPRSPITTDCRPWAFRADLTHAVSRWAFRWLRSRGMSEPCYTWRTSIKRQLRGTPSIPLFDAGGLQFESARAPWAHYNPAVTLGVWLRGRYDAIYLTAELVAGA